MCYDRWLANKQLAYGDSTDNIPRVNSNIPSLILEYLDGDGSEREIKGEGGREGGRQTAYVIQFSPMCNASLLPSFLPAPTSAVAAASLPEVNA